VADKKTTWKMQLKTALGYNKESLSDIIANTLSDEDLLITFDSGYGGSEGKPFTAWTENFIYFPAVYDGSEWVESVPRNPCDKATYHIGGQ